MKKVLTFSLIVMLTSPLFVGCKSGSSCLGGSCFSRNGSRVPAVSNFDDGSFSDSAYGPRVVNAANSGEIMMMSATSAYGQCAPCAPSACQPCAPTTCNPCDACGAAPTGTTSSGYPAGAYAGM